MAQLVIKLANGVVTNRQAGWARSQESKTL